MFICFTEFNRNCYEKIQFGFCKVKLFFLIYIFFRLLVVEDTKDFIDLEQDEQVDINESEITAEQVIKFLFS